MGATFRDEETHTLAAERHDVVVVGAGQAGLAAGACLKERGLDVVLLDGAERVGDSWRRRWDSLRLFTPVRYNHLPGLRFGPQQGLPPGHLPSKDEVADYLELYARHHALDVRLGQRVKRVYRADDGHVVETGVERFFAQQVIVASGGFGRPVRPELAADLDAGIAQLDGADYTNPDALPDGDVLVVGAGNTGMQIGMELARAGRGVTVAGRDTGAIPRKVLGLDIYFVLYGAGLLGLRTDRGLGARMAAKARGGDPLVGTPAAQVRASGVRRCGRIVDVRDSLPVTDAGDVQRCDVVIWCTGRRNDYSFLDGVVLDDDGRPRMRGGEAIGSPGLHFLGLRFLHRAGSSLLGGVGRDARALAERVAVRLNA